MDKAFDEEGYRIRPLMDEDREKFFYEDEYWCKNYQMSIVWYLKLYIFADKYSVHQLRDDIMTAFLGQPHYWEWYPDPDERIIPLAYDNLPASTKFYQLLVYSTAHFWAPCIDTASLLRSIREWDAEFALEVSFALAQRAIWNQEPSTSIHIYHNHLGLNEKACRERIKNRAHIIR
jgi:hypothetical protein